MSTNQSKDNTEQHIADILSLVELPERKVPTNERTAFKLNTDPAVATLPKMDFIMNHLTGTETAREVITFIAQVRELKMGLAIDEETQMGQFHTTVLSLLHGSVKEAYKVEANKAATARRAEEAAVATEEWVLTLDVKPTDAEHEEMEQFHLDATTDFLMEDFDQGINAMATQLLLFKALTKFKRYLRCHCHKASNMTIRQFVNRIRKINEHELPLLVPMLPTNSLGYDKIMELLFYGIPNRHCKKLQEMDIDLTNCPDYATFIQRAEHVEESDCMESNTNLNPSNLGTVPKKNKNGKSSNGKGKSYIRNEDTPNRNGSKKCILHGFNNTHTTDKCKVMKVMTAEKKTSSGNTINTSSYADKKKGNGKSYKKTFTKKELNALVAKGVRKELLAVSAARKKKAVHEANNVEIQPDDPVLEQLALDAEVAAYDFSLLEENDDTKMDEQSTSEDNEWLIGPNEILLDLNDTQRNNFSTDYSYLPAIFEFNAAEHLVSLYSCLDQALESHEDALSLNRLVQGQAPQQPKVRRVDDRRPYTFITLQPNTIDSEAIVLRALLDSGASSTIVAKNLLLEFQLDHAPQSQVWATPAGDMTTNQMLKTTFTFDELQPSKY